MIELFQISKIQILSAPKNKYAKIVFNESSEYTFLVSYKQYAQIVKFFKDESRNLEYYGKKCIEFIYYKPYGVCENAVADNKFIWCGWDKKWLSDTFQAKEIVEGDLGERIPDELLYDETFTASE